MNAPAQVLILTLRGRPPTAADTPSQMRLDTRGGRIGRAASCEWVLDGDGVSRLHATVRHLDGVYFIEDHSTNGMLHNGNALRAGFPAPLRDGDTLRIDVFDIDVTSVAESAVESPAAREPLDLSAASAGSPALPERRATPPAPLDDAIIPDHGGVRPTQPDADPLALFATSFTLAEADGASAPVLGHGPAMADAYRAPAAVRGSAGALLPEHWDRTRSEFTSSSAARERAPAQPDPPAATPTGPAPGPDSEPSQTQPSAPVQAHAPTSPAIHATAQTRTQPGSVAGQPAADTSTVPQLHALLAALTGGVIDVLRARAELKNSLRLPVTLIRRTENNPLKFAATVDEAMARLLAPADPAYLSGTAAVDDAMDDIGRHQLALLAGMRAAFEHVFAQFDPTRFEAEVGSRSALPAWTGRPWRRYTHYYRSLADDPDERFRCLFGEEFARAYEEQMARAKTGVAPSHGEPI